MFKQCCKKSDYRMSTAQNVFLRLSIVLGMVAATVTVLYFTPLPDHNFLSCDRPCHDLEWPMICRVKLIIGESHLYQRTCTNCSEIVNQCQSDHCFTEYSSSKPTFLINGQLPGPPIQVCQNDIIVVDVINQLEGHSLSMHWRGQPNDESPFMDGVPMITQCPISSYTTFQYKFRASNPGTHFYHAYSNIDRFNGLFGGLIVRQADKFEPHRKLYDIDDKTHLILISELQSVKTNHSNILINGKSSTKSVFNIVQGKRYRFRIANIGGNSGCPVTVSIQDHSIKIIALDGNSIKPYEVQSFTLNKGERLDFVLKSNQEVKKYLLEVKSHCDNKINEGSAVINYKGSNSRNDKKSEDIVESNARDFDTAICESRIGRVCIEDVKALEKIPTELRHEHVDKVVYLAFGSKKFDIGDYQTQIYGINNITFTYPPAPLLTQYDDIPAGMICDKDNVPEQCANKTICQCVYVENIPLGATTEIVLIDQGSTEEQVFHLHGQHFYLVGSRQFTEPSSVEEIKSMNEANSLFKRNLLNPVMKDTIRVPRNGAVALRFKANNPGFWMLRDENSRGWTRGMDVILQVGNIRDHLSSPAKFPKCGNFIGPEFFFI